MKLFVYTFALLIVLSGCSGHQSDLSTISLKSDVIDASEVIKGLPVGKGEVSESGNGRIQYRYPILFDKPTGLNINQSFEFVGDNQRDADVLGWQCATFNEDGSHQSAQDKSHFCHEFFNKVLAKFTPDHELIANNLIKQAQESEEAAYIDVGDLTFEASDYFYFVRKKSRYENGF